MKRKHGSSGLKNWRKSTIWGLSSILVLSVFLTGYGNTDREVIKDLLIKRSGIIQMVWYSSVTPSQGETMLKHVETHPLLGEDVSWLRSAEEGMGFAYVLDLDVLNVKQTSFSSRGTCYVAEILWELEEYNQHISEKQTYRIRTVKEADGSVKLAELEPMYN